MAKSKKNQAVENTPETEKQKTEKKGNRIFVTPPDPDVIHIIPRPDGISWSVKRDGVRNAWAVFSSKQDAIEEARKYQVVGKKLVLHTDFYKFEYI